MIVMVERNFVLFSLGKCCIVISGRNFGLFSLGKSRKANVAKFD
jgi:hypothetical protein